MPRGGRRTRSGPPPTPTALRALKGGRERVKRAGREPEYEQHDHAPPPGLTEHEVEIWRHVVPLISRAGVFTRADEQAAVLAVQALADHARLRRQVLAEGDTVVAETEHGVVIRAHPAARLMSDAWRRAQAALSTFGMDPASRSKLRVETPPPKDPVSEWRERHGA